MATKKVQKNKVIKSVDGFKAQAKNLHDGALTTTENLVEETLATGEEWQNLLSKALQGGTKLFGQQQEMLLEGLEGLKGQYTTGSIRLRKLLTFKPLEKKAKKVAEKAVKTVKSEIDEVMDKVEKEATKVKAVAKKATANSNKLKTAPVKKTTAVKTPKAKPMAKSNGAVPKTAVAKNDLTKIEGIGPKIAGLLNDAGILTFQQLGVVRKAELQKILDAAGARYRMHDPSTWAKQAKMAAMGKIAELKTWQDELKGGKKVKKS